MSMPSYHRHDPIGDGESPNQSFTSKTINVTYNIGSRTDRNKSSVEVKRSQLVARIADRTAYWGHEFDLSRSRDIIGHVTI